MNLRYLWRSVSLVFVLCFALFPTLSYASETVTDETYTYDWREAEMELLEYSSTSGGVTTWTVDKDDISNGLVQATFQFITRSDWVLKYQSVPYSWVSPLEIPVFEFSSAHSNFDSFNASSFGSGMTFNTILSTVDGSKLISSGDAFNLVLNGLKHQMRYNYQWSWSQVNVGGGSGGGVAYYPLDTSKIDYVSIVFVGQNGEMHEVTFEDDAVAQVLTVNGDTFGVEVDLTAPNFNTYQLHVHLMYENNPFNWSVPNASHYHNGAYHVNGTGIYLETAVYNGVLKLETPDETTGLLSGIIEWLRSIRDGIANVANYVLELPSRIWTFIQEGLKMLFIPSEQDISNMHNQWDELMRDRFGAIYESGDIVHSFADTMNVNSAMVADTGGVITMPSVTANLAGTNFTFGGYEVDLVPDGFQWLVTSIKMLINIVCTILFINALKAKIEVLLR